MSTAKGNWAKTIQPKSDQLNADDLIGGNKIIRIRDVKVIDSAEQPASVFYDGDNGKPYKPSKTMRKIMAHCWGLNEADYVGRWMELYRDESVKWAGEAVGGIRIRAMSHIPERKRISLQISRNQKMPFTIEPLQPPATASQPAEQSSSVSAPEPATQAKNYADNLKKQFADAQTEQELEAVWDSSRKVIGRLQDGYPSLYEGVNDAYLVRKDALSNPPIDADGDFDVFGLPEIEPNHAAGN